MPKSQKKIKGGKFQIPGVDIGSLRSAATSAGNGIDTLQKFIKNIETKLQESQMAIKKSGLVNPAYAGGYIKSKPVVKKPVTKPVVKKPVTKPVVKKPVTKPVVKKPVTKPVVKKPVTKPVVKKPVVTKPVVKKPVTKPVVKKPVTKPVVKKPVTKPVVKKPVVKSKTKKTSKGGGGSDWMSSVNSRGNSAAPDSYWGYPGELWFRQFNKTGEYIPNSQLAFAAAPISTCPDNESD
jgi:hypothetical protein